MGATVVLRGTEHPYILEDVEIHLNDR